uniref:Anaphase-promoting complex subunit 4-like WD40 domain-containing protein n=1 Tax=Arcella intermedia TaxID=1963864 RepID=A0A6B2KZ99_9EUKA
MLNYWKIPFSGKDLSYSVMINADFSNGILDGTNLLGAKLIHANFSGSVLRNTDFTHCDLHTVEFGEFPVVSLVDTPCGITFGHDANTFFVAGVSKCLCYANGKISKITTNCEITSIAYNLAHDALAVSTTENVSFIWLKTGEKREICKQQQKLKFSLDGQYFVTCKRKIISVWSFSGSLLFELDQYSVILFLEFSPKLDFLISCSSKQIYVWDMKERKLIKSFPNPSPIRYMAINPTHSHLLAVAGDDMIIYLWDLRTSVNFTNLTGHFEKIRQLKFSPDGSLLASASGGTRSRDNSVRVWSISNYSLYATFAGHTESVVGVDISPEGLLVSCSYDNTVRRTKIYSKRNTIAEVGPSAAINCGCWSSDGNFFAITCDDNTVTLFSAKCYQLLHTIPTNSSAYMAQFSGDCSILVAIDVSGSVFILSTKDFSLKTIVLGSQLLLLTLAVSPDGSEIFIGGPTTKVHIKDGIPKVSKGDVISYCLCYTPTGKYLLTSTVKGLQVRCNQTVKSISLSSCGNAIFSPDGKSIAVALYDHIQLFSVDLEEKQTLQGVDNSEILALAFNPSGSILVSQGRNHKICVWDVLKGVLISELSLHSGVTAFGAFSPDGQRYLSVSWDQSFTIWKVREGEEWIVIWRFSQSPGLVAKAAKIPVNKLSYNNKQLLKQYGALMVD